MKEEADCHDSLCSNVDGEDNDNNALTSTSMAPEAEAPGDDILGRKMSPLSGSSITLLSSLLSSLSSVDMLYYFAVAAIRE